MADTNYLDEDLGITGPAAEFLRRVDDAVNGRSDKLPVPRGSEYVKQIVRGLVFRIINERGTAQAKVFAPRHNAGQRLRRGKAANGQYHTTDKKGKALALFNRLVADGSTHKKAEGEVKRRYSVSPRTLRFWRKQSPASH